MYWKKVVRYMSSLLLDKDRKQLQLEGNDKIERRRSSPL